MKKTPINFGSLTISPPDIPGLFELRIDSLNILEGYPNKIFLNILLDFDFQFDDSGDFISDSWGDVRDICKAHFANLYPDRICKIHKFQSELLIEVIDEDII